MQKINNETNIIGVRQMSKALLFAVNINCDNQFGIVSHPFTNSIFSFGENGEIVNLTEKDAFIQWRYRLGQQIDQSGLDRIYTMINKPWLITWLKFVKPNLSDRDFAEYLADAYILEEMPNLNPDISVEELIDWFKSADKSALMSNQEYQSWVDLPDTIALFRGVSHSGSEHGLSWSNSRKTAEWFANRFANETHPGRVYEVVAPKECCLCYFNNRGENEIILDVNAVKNKIIQIV